MALMIGDWSREMCIAHLRLHGAQFVMAVIGKRGNFYAVLSPAAQLLFRDPDYKDAITIGVVSNFRGRWREVPDTAMHWYSDDDLRAFCVHWEV